MLSDFRERLGRFDLVFCVVALVYGLIVVKELVSPSLILDFSSPAFGEFHLSAGFGSAIGFGAGFVGAVFGGFIGILTILFLTFFGNVPITLAKGTNMFQTAFTALFALGNHYKAGTADPRVGGAVAAGGLLGAWQGAAWSATLPEETMKIIFSGALVVGAFYMAFFAFKGGFGDGEVHTDRAVGFLPEAFRVRGEFRGSSYSIDVLSALVLGVLIGVVAGVLGIGGGFMITPSIHLLLGLPIHLSVGSATTVIMANAASATGSYLQQGAVFVSLGVAIFVGGFFGARIGQKVNHMLPGRALKLLFSLLLIWSAWRMLPEGVL